MKKFLNITIYILYHNLSAERLCGKSKSLIVTGTLAAKFYGTNSPNFIGKYYTGLLGCSRLCFLIVFESC